MDKWEVPFIINIFQPKSFVTSNKTRVVDKLDLVTRLVASFNGFALIRPKVNLRTGESTEIMPAK